MNSKNNEGPFIGFYNYTVIPTYIGLASSIVGIFIAIRGHHPFLAIMCLMFSGLCDMYDGMIARTRERTKMEKNFGIQIDSLSDLICFGVLPVLIGYSIGMRSWVCVLVFIVYILATLIRLGYFNVLEEERQGTTTEKRKNYTGLPVTTAALIFPFIFGLHIFFGEQAGHYMPYVYAGSLLVTSFAFLGKFKVKKPHGKYLFLVLIVGIIEIVLLILCVKFFGKYNFR